MSTIIEFFCSNPFKTGCRTLNSDRIHAIMTGEPNATSEGDVSPFAKTVGVVLTEADGYLELGQDSALGK